MAALIYSAAMLVNDSRVLSTSRSGSALWLSLALVVYVSCIMVAINTLTLRSPIEGGTWQQVDNHYHWQHPQFLVEKHAELYWRIGEITKPFEVIDNNWAIPNVQQLQKAQQAELSDPSNIIVLGPERPLWQVIAGAWSQ